MQQCWDLSCCELYAETVNKIPNGILDMNKMSKLILGALPPILSSSINQLVHKIKKKKKSEITGQPLRFHDQAYVLRMEAPILLSFVLRTFYSIMS